MLLQNVPQNFVIHSDCIQVSRSQSCIRSQMQQIKEKNFKTPTNQATSSMEETHFPGGVKVEHYKGFSHNFVKIAIESWIILLCTFSVNGFIFLERTHLRAL